MAVLKQYRVVQNGVEVVIHFETETAAITDLSKWANENVVRLGGDQVLTEEQQAAVRSTLGTITELRFEAIIPTTGWESCDEELYSVSVGVPGIIEDDDFGDFFYRQVGDESVDKPVREAYATITRVTATTDGVVVYASAVPSVEIPVRLKVTR